MDRTKLDGRPMFISPSVDKSKNPTQFKVGLSSFIGRRGSLRANRSRDPNSTSCARYFTITLLLYVYKWVFQIIRALFLSVKSLHKLG